MAAPSVAALMVAIASAVDVALADLVDLGEVQVTSTMNLNPTPPAIDIYPAEEFTEQIGFGVGVNRLNFTVRARVGTVANVEGQELLLSLMTPSGDTSLAEALTEQFLSIDGVSYPLNVTGPTGFQVYRDTGGGGDLIGCAWTVGVLL
jgi:hypothetical protein